VTVGGHEGSVLVACQGRRGPKAVGLPGVTRRGAIVTQRGAIVTVGSEGVADSHRVNLQGLTNVVNPLGVVGVCSSGVPLV